MNYLSKSVKIIIVFTMLFTAFTSCQKNTIDSISSEEGNYLKFQDRTELLEVYEKLANANNDDLISSYATENKYTSSIQVLEEFEELANDENATLAQLTSYLENSDVLHITEDSSVALILEDPVFSGLINERGLIQVSDTIYQYRPNDIIAIPIDVETGQPIISLKDAKHFTETNEELGVKVIPIIRSVSDSYSKSGDCNKKKCTNGYASKRRLKGKIYVTNLWFVKSHGAYSKSQKRRWFWFGTKVPTIKLLIATPGDSYRNYTRNNASKVKVVLSFAAGTNPFIVPGFSTALNGMHYIENSNGSFKCSTCRD